MTTRAPAKQSLDNLGIGGQRYKPKNLLQGSNDKSLDESYSNLTTANKKAAKSSETCLVLEMTKKMRFQERVKLFENLARAQVGTGEITSIDKKRRKKIRNKRYSQR